MEIMASPVARSDVFASILIKICFSFPLYFQQKIQKNQSRSCSKVLVSSWDNFGTLARTKVTTRTTRNMPSPPRVRVISRPSDSIVLRES